MAVSWASAAMVSASAARVAMDAARSCSARIASCAEGSAAVLAAIAARTSPLVSWLRVAGRGRAIVAAAGAAGGRG